jgi:hypothetical protein
MKKKITPQGETNTSQKPLAKVIVMMHYPRLNKVKANDASAPTLSDIMKMQAMVMDDAPDINAPIVLSDTWYEFSVFKRLFNLSAGTANKWLEKYLPSSKIEKMRFLNKADIESMLLQFRRYGLFWIGFVLSFSNNSEELLDVLIV